MNRISIKYLVTLLAVHMAFYFAMAQKQASITVKVHSYSGSSVSLYKVENGEAKRMSFRWPAKNDTCVFNFSLDQETVFYLRKTGGKGLDHKYVLYLKPGENKRVYA